MVYLGVEYKMPNIFEYLEAAAGLPPREAFFKKMVHTI